MTSGVITNTGKNLLLQRVGASTKTPISKFKVGIGTTTPVVSDTTLTIKVPISGTEQVDDCEATTGWTASASDSVTLNSTTYKQGIGALNLIKAATGVVTCSMYKTTTSRDYTSKELWVFVYISSTLYAGIEASSTALEIRFGSDSSNYYYKTYTKSQLASGWNYLYFNSSGATGTTGSPSIAACDYTYISYVTAAAATTTSAGAFIVDDLKVASSDDYVKIFASGYPTVDTGTREMTTRCVLSSTEANGYVVSEVGIENTEATPDLYSHDTFTAITKSSLVEIIFELIDTQS